MHSNKINTVSEELKVIAFGEIKPPPHIRLRKKDLPFWESVVNTRARTTWTEADICHAANLARTFCDIEDLARAMVKCKKEDRQQKRKESESLIKQSIVLSRILNIHTVATQGRDTGKRTRKEKELLSSQPKDDGLLIGPVVQ